MATTIIINYYFKSDLVLTLILIFWSARIPSLYSMAFYRAPGDKKLGTRCLQCFNPCWAGFTYSRQGKYDSRRAKKLGSAQFYCNSAGSGFLECGPDRSFKPHLKTEQFLKKKKVLRKQLNQSHMQNYLRNILPWDSLQNTSGSFTRKGTVESDICPIFRV